MTSGTCDNAEGCPLENDRDYNDEDLCILCSQFIEEDKE